MKKTKLILTASLVLLLCLLCLAGNTFSWFSRPNEVVGKQLDFSETYSSAVNEGLSFETYESTDGGLNYTTKPTSFSETSGIAGGDRKYYRTDIYNTGVNPQSVSLYLESLTFGNNTDGFALGVNGPSKTFKKFTEEVNNELVSTDKMRVYFQPKNDNNWQGGEYNVCYGVTDNPSYYVELQETPTAGTYYADIPANAKKLFFAVKDYTETWQRTQTFSDLVADGQSPLNSFVFMISGRYDSTSYNNAQADKQVVNGSNIATYYKIVKLTKNAVFPAGLVVNQNYIAESISYSSSNNSVFTVSSDGKITGVGVGTATLTVETVGESFDDISKVTTTVVVTDKVDSISDVPVVTNVEIQPSVLDADTNSPLPSVSIYWYIKNDSTKDGMTYTIPELYLTL